MSNESEIPKDDDTSFGKQAFSENQQTNKVKPVDLKNIKARVDKVHIDGLNRTKDDVVQAQVKELFNAKDFQDIIVNAHAVRGKLESLGCFKTIGVYIDTSQGLDSTPEGVEVTFKVHELKRIMGSINTMVGNNEASLLVGAKSPNLFGRGERLQVDYSYGHKNSSNINISAMKPFYTGRLSKVLTASVYNTSTEFPWSGYRENDKGFLLDFAFDSNESGTFKHNLQYEGIVRDLSATKQATFKVREQCGPTLKSSLRHICTVDKRDEKIFPSYGTLVQCTTEVAGLGGNIGFVKNELAFQTNYSPVDSLTFQLAAQTGFLRGINNDMHITIADNFFLGGPMNVRGFEIRGCGPREEGFSLGGNTYWAAALHFYSPLPFRPGKNTFGNLFRLHGFVNGGNVNNATIKLGGTYEENLKILTENVRCTAGCGVAMKIGNIARIELNFCVPLKLLRTDVFQQVQLGLGVQYL
ncbi:sorting and assembly machinery component 50 homolog isoform X2 [Copidosoma floridanum]|nr:sorting and assembly machinery component 50 homolog isoform X2 [Copidosoma floridanum]XP_014206964.1 sorting and assembly machinery component 50 homolog isoform X2 [Copidosoma floridanum]